MDGVNDIKNKAGKRERGNEARDMLCNLTMLLEIFRSLVGINVLKQKVSCDNAKEKPTASALVDH